MSDYYDEDFKVPGELIVKCNKCDRVHKVPCSSLDWYESSDEKPMGLERVSSARFDETCKCKARMLITITHSEYVGSATSDYQYDKELLEIMQECLNPYGEPEIDEENE